MTPHRLIGCLVLAAAFVMEWPLAAPAADGLVQVRIILRTPAGKSVTADVERRVGGGPWTTIRRRVQGEVTLMEERCDQTVEYRAISTSSYYERDINIAIRCTQPEVAIADFYPTVFGSLDITKLREPAIWAEALGGGDAAAAAQAGKFASTFDDAISKGDYGTVAVVGTQVADQLKRVGKMGDAELFEAVAADATVRGALAASKTAPESIQILQPATTLTPAAKDVLVGYQKSKLGYTDTTPSLGQPDLTTMRSLPGGSSPMASEVRLPPAAASRLNAEAFVK